MGKQDISDQVSISPEIALDWLRKNRDLLSRKDLTQFTEEQVSQIEDEIMYVENGNLVIEATFPDGEVLKASYSEGWGYNNCLNQGGESYGNVLHQESDQSDVQGQVGRPHQQGGSQHQGEPSGKEDEGNGHCPVG